MPRLFHASSLREVIATAQAVDVLVDTNHQSMSNAQVAAEGGSPKTRLSGKRFSRYRVNRVGDEAKDRVTGDKEPGLWFSTLPPFIGFRRTVYRASRSTD